MANPLGACVYTERITPQMNRICRYLHGAHALEIERLAQLRACGAQNNQPSFAMACSLAAVSMQAATLNTVATMPSEHRSDIIALAWCPSSLRDESSDNVSASARLAAIDTDGLLVVWSIHNSQPLTVSSLTSGARLCRPTRHVLMAQ